MMKGMQKIKRGSGFRGVLNYVLDGGKLLGGNMSATDPLNLSREFGVTRRLRSDIEKPVWHNSLRLPKGERLSEKKWVEIADDYMQEMGFELEHMRSYVLHDDDDGQHIHIVASRVSIDSKVYLGRNENLKSTRVISELEQKYGLTETPTNQSKNDRSRLSRNELGMSERLNEIAPKQHIQNTIDAVFPSDGVLDVYSFIEQLHEQGVIAKPNVAKTGRMNGFSFEYEGIAFKASQLGRGYGWPRLSERVDYDADKHAVLLRQYVDSGCDIWKIKAINDDENRRIADSAREQQQRITAFRTAAIKAIADLIEQIVQRQREIRATEEAIERSRNRAASITKYSSEDVEHMIAHMRLFIEQDAPTDFFELMRKESLELIHYVNDYYQLGFYDEFITWFNDVNADNIRLCVENAESTYTQTLDAIQLVMHKYDNAQTAKNGFGKGWGGYDELYKMPQR